MTHTIQAAFSASICVCNIKIFAHVVFSLWANMCFVTFAYLTQGQRSRSNFSKKFTKYFHSIMIFYNQNLNIGKIKSFPSQWKCQFLDFNGLCRSPMDFFWTFTYIKYLRLTLSTIVPSLVKFPGSVFKLAKKGEEKNNNNNNNKE